MVEMMQILSDGPRRTDRSLPVMMSCVMMRRGRAISRSPVRWVASCCWTFSRDDDTLATGLGRASTAEIGTSSLEDFGSAV